MTKRFFSQTKDTNAINISGFYQSILYIISDIELDYPYCYCLTTVSLLAQRAMQLTATGHCKQSSS